MPVRLELRSTGRLRKANGAAVRTVLGSLEQALTDPALDLATLRIVCDWVQYKNNFREPVTQRPILDGDDRERVEIAIDLRRASVEQAPAEGNAEPVVLEPWGPMSASLVWSFNALYWKALGLWEALSGRTYEETLPGGESDARNADGARESILRLFRVWDGLAARRALPDQLHVLELGVGNGNQARVWLDTFRAVDRELGRDYYRRLHYLLGDYSRHLLELARGRLGRHADHISTLVLDALRPSTTLGFLRYKLFFVYISNTYDNLPTDEIARIDGRLYAVETRAVISAERAATLGVPSGELPELIRRLLRLGPELLAEAEPQRFPDRLDAVRFWAAVWDVLGLEERYVPLPPLDEYVIAPGVHGDALRSLVEGAGDVRMHVSNGAAASFLDTLPLLHPHGSLECHDLFVTALEQYDHSFRGPGKYDGSVVNWVNGSVLAAIGRRRGFQVAFRKFAHRAGSNITTMTAEVRE
jgi:hypothetical protein